MKTEKGKHEMEASLTVEASVVMSIVLMSIMTLILFDFRLHDKAAAENALICAVEMYGHRNRNAPWALDYRIIAEDTDIYITGNGQEVKLTPGVLSGSISGSVSFEENSWTYNNRNIRPEQLLRAGTLTDLVKKKKKESEISKEKSSEKEQEGTD